MIRKTTAVLLFIAATMPNGYLAAESSQAAWPDGRPGVLHTTAVADGLRFCSRNGPDGISSFWEVPSKAIPAIDAALQKHLRTSRLYKQLTLPASKYQRQYLGFSRGEARFVYINAFPARYLRAMPDPTNELPRICDGGSLTWGIEYDMKRRTFSGFAPNF